MPRSMFHLPTDALAVLNTVSALVAPSDRLPKAQISAGCRLLYCRASSLMRPFAVCYFPGIIGGLMVSWRMRNEEESVKVVSKQGGCILSIKVDR